MLICSFACLLVCSFVRLLVYKFIYYIFIYFCLLSNYAIYKVSFSWHVPHVRQSSCETEGVLLMRSPVTLLYWITPPQTECSILVPQLASRVDSWPQKEFQSSMLDPLPSRKRSTVTWILQQKLHTIIKKSAVCLKVIEMLCEILWVVVLARLDVNLGLIENIYCMLETLLYMA